MASRAMTHGLIVLVAARFKALSEPARLQLLNALRSGEFTVGDLAERTKLGQANVSKHLHSLHALGFVKRRKEGLFVYYGLADKTVSQLCDIMCGHIDTEVKARRKLLSA